MKRLSTILAALLFIAFAATGISYAVKDNQQLKVEQIRLQSTDAKLKELQLKYDVLNKDLDQELQKNTTDEERVKQLEQEKQQLEQQKQDLERQLQAKLDAKNAAARQFANAVTGTRTASAAVSGDKVSWMNQAGIPASDHAAVDYIVSHEGGWHGTTRWNTAGSGAYGLCQALPASKMASAGSDYMTNPITQLRWCHGYAQQRYGGWWSAYNFWLKNHWW
jgi:TolA-binding protein